MAKRKPVATTSTGELEFKCQGKFCPGYSSLDPPDNKPQVYHLTMFGEEGNILAHKVAWLCKQCMSGNRRFFNGPFEL